jgi:hypothetical protein
MNENGMKSVVQRNGVGLIGQERFQKEVKEMIGRRLIGEARGRPKKTVRSSAEKVL